MSAVVYDRLQRRKVEKEENMKTMQLFATIKEVE